MRSIRLVAVMLAVLVGLASCSRDPNVVKRRYLESGNKYFDKGRYKEASIDRKSTRLNSSHLGISYAVFCLKKKTHIADRAVHNHGIVGLGGTIIPSPIL